MLSVMIPQALFSIQHAHKFLVFTAGQKCAKACSTSLTNNIQARMESTLARRQSAGQGHNASKPLGPLWTLFPGAVLYVREPICRAHVL